MDISVVIPLYNEEALVPELISRLFNALNPVSEDFEILFVDDGSRDQTLVKLLEARAMDHRIKILELSRNFGHQAAFTAGLRHTSGDFIVMLDGDLEDPPEIIPELYAKLKSGTCDVVYAKRTGNLTEPRRIIHSLFHRIFRKISGLTELENAGHYSMFNRKALEAFLSFSETIRYLPGLRQHIGFRQDFVEYARQPRKSGKSKMSTGKLLTLSSDAIFSFSKLPLRICLYLGLIGIVVFFLAGLYTLIAKIAGFAILGWSSTLLSIYFLGSIQLTFLGILGEYVYRIYKESQNRPVYFIKDFHQ